MHVLFHECHVVTACTHFECHISSVTACTHFEQLDSQHRLCANHGLHETRSWRIVRNDFCSSLDATVKYCCVPSHSATITFLNLPVSILSYDFVSSPLRQCDEFSIGRGGRPVLFLVFQLFSTLMVSEARQRNRHL